MYFPFGRQAGHTQALLENQFAGPWGKEESGATTGVEQDPTRRMSRFLDSGAAHHTGSENPSNQEVSTFCFPGLKLQSLFMGLEPF